MGRKADESKYIEEENALWQRLRESQNQVWRTSKGLEFRYRIVGNEMFVERKAKSVTRATVNVAYRVAKEKGIVSGPKKLGVFGSSYLWAVFVGLGVCKTE